MLKRIVSVRVSTVRFLQYNCLRPFCFASWPEKGGTWRQETTESSGTIARGSLIPGHSCRAEPQGCAAGSRGCTCLRLFSLFFFAFLRVSTPGATSPVTSQIPWSSRFSAEKKTTHAPVYVKILNNIVLKTWTSGTTFSKFANNPFVFHHLFLWRTGSNEVYGLKESLLRNIAENREHPSIFLLTNNARKQGLQFEPLEQHILSRARQALPESMWSVNSASIHEGWRALFDEATDTDSEIDADCQARTSSLPTFLEEGGN